MVVLGKDGFKYKFKGIFCFKASGIEDPIKEKF